jgi:hypothetical protein
MSRRTLISLAATAIVGIVCIATISTDAFAYRRGVAFTTVASIVVAFIVVQPYAAEWP